MASFIFSHKLYYPSFTGNKWLVLYFHTNSTTYHIQAINGRFYIVTHWSIFFILNEFVACLSDVQHTRMGKCIFNCLSIRVYIHMYFVQSCNAAVSYVLCLSYLWVAAITWQVCSYIAKYNAVVKAAFRMLGHKPLYRPISVSPCTVRHKQSSKPRHVKSCGNYKTITYGASTHWTLYLRWGET